VFHVRTITRRRQPIYPAAVVGKPPQEDRYMGDASQMILGPLLRLMRPEVRDVWAYYQAGFHNLLVASVEARYTREPVRTALGLLGEGQLGLSKVLIMVDDAVDARAFRSVLRAIRANFDPRENFHLISRAPLDTLDFTSFKMHHGSRIILDATGSRAQYSAVAPMRRRQCVRRRSPIPSRGRPSRATRKISPVHQGGARVGRHAARRAGGAHRDRHRTQDSEPLVQSPHTSRLKLIAVISPDVNIDDDVDVIWGIFTRFDPARDLMFTRSEMRGVQPLYRRRHGNRRHVEAGISRRGVDAGRMVRLVDSRWGTY
jgi:4-hydroxy-3-polyprenylbenzoate decarboxylase